MPSAVFHAQTSGPSVVRVGIPAGAQQGDATIGWHDARHGLTGALHAPFIVFGDIILLVGYGNDVAALRSSIWVFNPYAALLPMALAFVATSPFSGRFDARFGAVAASRSGTAAALINVARMAGATLGVAILGAIFALPHGCH